MPNSVSLLRIGTENIIDGAVTTEKIANSAVTTEKIADLAVVNAKLGNGSVNINKIANGAVTSVKIANGAVVTDKIANSAVTQVKLADKSAYETKVKIGFINWHASSVPITDVTLTGLLNGWYLFTVWADAVFNDTTAYHHLNVYSGANTGHIDAFMLDGGGDSCGCQLINTINVSVGEVEFVWDGYHIHHINMIWLGLP